MTGASFILMHKVQAKPENAKEVLKFFDWSFKNGDQMASELDYVPMPDPVVKLIQTEWKSKIKDESGKVGVLSKPATRCPASRLDGRGRWCMPPPFSCSDRFFAVIPCKIRPADERDDPAHHGRRHDR